MKKHLKVIVFSLITVLLFFIYFSNKSEADLESYIEIVEAKREETDRFMKTSGQSPFQDSLKLSYSGLNYFPPNPDYRVQAIINLVEVPDQLIIPTSDGKRQRYEKFAYAEFKLAGQRHRLLLLKIVGGDGTIFTAFADETSGESTYGGGRYIDLKFKNARQITLDFNFAYNPFCAYNGTFSCPLPPPENILTIPIMAVEKNYD